MSSVTKLEDIKGDKIKAISNDFSSTIEFHDHKIQFVTNYCKDKDVLDIGCVHHDPENYKSKYWLHKAIKAVSSKVVGIDLYKDGVEYLSKLGFDIQLADAQTFRLDRKFDVIVAADIIEHLEDFSGFLESCKQHMHENTKLLISTPNPWYWKHFVKAALYVEVPNNIEHTCWLCPRTLKQLLERHELKVNVIKFGSRYKVDRFMPLPRGWKHTSFHVEVSRNS